MDKDLLLPLVDDNTSQSMDSASISTENDHHDDDFFYLIIHYLRSSTANDYDDEEEQSLLFDSDSGRSMHFVFFVPKTGRPAPHLRKLAAPLTFPPHPRATMKPVEVFCFDSRPVGQSLVAGVPVGHSGATPKASVVASGWPTAPAAGWGNYLG